jgi:hypothetical protein
VREYRISNSSGVMALKRNRENGVAAAWRRKRRRNGEIRKSAAKSGEIGNRKRNVAWRSENSWQIWRQNRVK